MTYSGTAYLGVVGPEQDFAAAWKSIANIKKRPHDAGPFFFNGTKGYELRQLHINKFLESDHDWLLLLDHDMTFPSDTLERLRSHGKSFVSGLYMRRQIAPMAPIWYYHNPDNEWPNHPYATVPERGKLHQIAASGWGCMLVHRQVIEDTRPILKGEPEVIEDDMDIWPYDLDTVFEALDRGDIDTLRQELRPLTGQKSTVQGSDLRFPFYARQAGHQLWGDPDVRCGHLLFYPLSPDDFERADPDYLSELRDKNAERVTQGRELWRQRVTAL